MKNLSIRQLTICIILLVLAVICKFWNEAGGFFAMLARSFFIQQNVQKAGDQGSLPSQDRTRCASAECLVHSLPQ